MLAQLKVPPPPEYVGVLLDYDLEEARNAIGRDISNIGRIAA